jgi:membrane associated rhomboid family serine protease
VPAWLTLITYVFPHGAWWHVTLNLLGLCCLGRLAEPALGAGRFLLAYFASGLVCGISLVLLAPSWTKPAAGASGAIAGVLGGFLAMRLRRPPGWGRPLLLEELAGVFWVALWLLLRTPPPAPDRPTALLQMEFVPDQPTAPWQRDWLGAARKGR